MTAAIVAIAPLTVPGRPNSILQPDNPKSPYHINVRGVYVFCFMFKYFLDSIGL